MFQPTEHLGASWGELLPHAHLIPRLHDNIINATPQPLSSFHVRPGALMATATLLAFTVLVTGCAHVTVFIPSAGFNVLLGNTLQFTATVTGSSNTSVSWSVDGVVGGSSTTGTISESGLYTAPGHLPSQATVSVTATSRADSSKSATVQLTLKSDIAVTVTTNPVSQFSVPPGGTVQLSAIISSAGHPDPSVAWSVNGVSNGNSTVGTIATTGTNTAVYTAPQAYPNPNPVQIIARSVADPLRAGTTQVTISILVSVSPSALNVLLGNTAPFTSTVIGSSNTSVAWSVNGVPSGNSAFGTITNSGLYKAPAVLPIPSGLTITATSLADSSRSAVATVNIISDVTVGIEMNPGQQPIAYGAIVQLTATISSAGHPDTGVDWGAFATGSVPVGTIVKTGPQTATYTAPQSYANVNPVQIIAQSLADSSRVARMELKIFADVVLAGTGDIADRRDLRRARATANLLSSIQGTFFADGDLVYDSGTDAEFRDWYDPTWGPLKRRTIPVVGNHEYETPNAQGYFNYWGATAGDPTKGYYSFDLGAWHVVVLNSSCEESGIRCDTGSPQQQWLEGDLRQHPGVCTLALWHAPYFVAQGNPWYPTDEPQLKGIWETLIKADTHLVINGHVHDYQRWKRQDAGGNATGAGIRQFVIGTGGAVSTHDFCLLGTPGCCGPIGAKCSGSPTKSIWAANLEVVGNTGGQIDQCGSDPTACPGLAYQIGHYGVLKLTLHQDSYDWEHKLVNGDFGDSGTESCHSLPSIIRPFN
jgi:hypothetical protein